MDNSFGMFTLLVSIFPIESSFVKIGGEYLSGFFLVIKVFKN